MRRISIEEESRILKGILKGRTYREIARSEGVSIATVARVVETERTITPDLDELRTLALKLKKTSFSLFDAIRACSLIERLKELGVPFQELEDYINLSERLLSERNTDVDLIPHAIKLMKLETENGKPIQEIMTDAKKALKSTTKLEAKTKASLRTLQKTLRRQKMIEAKLDKTNSELQEAIATQKGLNEIGVPKLSILAKFTKEFESLNFDAKKVKKLAKLQEELEKVGIPSNKLEEYVARRGSLQSQNRRLELENDKLSALNRSQYKLNQDLTQRNMTLKNIDKILTTRRMAIPCKICGGLQLMSLQTEEELYEMMEKNLAIPITCSICGSGQLVSAWDFLFQIGMLVAPEDNYIIVKIQQTQ